MQIKSQAGEFDIEIVKFETEGDDLVMVGAMGVWQARTHITARDALRLVRLLVTSAAVWGYLLRLPLLLVRGRAK